MASKKPQFKSYCWNVGSTSFREQQLSYKSEILLRYLSDIFRRNPGKAWRDLQSEYYDALIGGGFISGAAKRKDKDARQKTTGLEQIGLCTKDRKITEVGKKLVELSESGDFSSQNIFAIDEDDYLYLLQFLKYQVDENGFSIKPFLAFLYMTIKLGGLSRDEFTYCLPVSRNPTEVIENTVFLLNNKKDFKVDAFLLKKIMSMANYKEALKIFLSEPGFDEKLVAKVGMHRKSHDYDKPFALFFEELFLAIQSQTSSSTEEKIEHLNKIRSALSKINNNQKADWGKLLGLQASRVFDEDDLPNFFGLDLCNVTTEEEFKTKVFKQWHLFKWKATLEDYYDLNKRYFSLTGIVRFDQQKFQLTEMGGNYFEDIIDRALLEPLKAKNQYGAHFRSLVPIGKISPLFVKTRDDLVAIINKKYGKDFSLSEVEKYILDVENEQFLRFVDSKFSNNILVSLLDDFKNRNDERIKTIVTKEATVPTSFEYIVAIIWYNLSGREGYLKKQMRLSLDSDYLPKSHAQGGGADIVFSYEKKQVYPKHDMLLEVTLSESTGQRHMEWEPVCRHLETHIQKNHNLSDYVVFVASSLDQRTISAFRTQKWYSFNDGGIERTGLKILPIDCDLLKHILEANVSYTSLFPVFSDAFNSNDTSLDWHAKCLVSPIKSF